MDIQYRSCRYCYVEIPDCYLIDGLCDACVRTETTNQMNKYPLADRAEWWGDCDYQRRNGQMVTMRPQDYLARVRSLEIDAASRENIDDLKAHVLSGRSLDPLAIYANGKEDGRHRAYAAIELGIQVVPVILFAER